MLATNIVVTIKVIATKFCLSIIIGNLDFAGGLFYNFMYWNNVATELYATPRIFGFYTIFLRHTDWTTFYTKLFPR